MTVRTVYCSACDRNVVLFVDAEPQTTDRPDSKVCLDYGDRCTGEMCPILAAPSEEIRANLMRLRAQR